MITYLASVIVPTYNRRDELRLTLDSVVKQICQYSFEVIVADDGSSEDIESVVNEYADVISIKYCFQEDKGFRAGAARNMGIKLAKGDLCIFVDSGIILHPKSIEEFISIYLKEGNCAIVGYIYGFKTKAMSMKQIEDLKQIIEANSFDDAIPLFKDRDFLDAREYIFQALGDELHQWPAPFIVFWSGNMAVPRKLLLEVGMFDEYFNTWGGEDTELGLSLQKAGAKFILARKACAVHYPHEVNRLNLWLSNPEEALEQLREKQLYMLKKHPITAMKFYMSIYEPVMLNKMIMEYGGLEEMAEVGGDEKGQKRGVTLQRTRKENRHEV